MFRQRASWLKEALSRSGLFRDFPRIEDIRLAVCSRDIVLVQNLMWAFLASFGRIFFSLIAFSVCFTLFLSAFGLTLGLNRSFASLLLRLFDSLARSEFLRESIEEEDQDSDHSDDDFDGIRVVDRGQQNGSSTVFELDSIVSTVMKAVAAVKNDVVTASFERVDQVTVWNLLARNQQFVQFPSYRLRAIYIAGIFVRYGILLPFRLVLFSAAMTWLFASVLVMKVARKWLTPESCDRLSQSISLVLFRVMARVFSSIINNHYDPHVEPNSICVANHTTPIDAIFLGTQNKFALIGQRQSGLFGLVQRMLSLMNDQHIWFERSNSNDRHRVFECMRAHIWERPKGTACPLLLFPEGTCINNTTVMMFKKGAFEIGCPIYPIAIKYDIRLGDAFWNSSRTAFGSYVLMLMTSWAIYVDIYHLEPLERNQDETSVQFASRVKRAIALQGGFIDLEWDGNLKRSKPNPKYKAQQQLLYSNKIISRTASCMHLSANNCS